MSERRDLMRSVLPALVTTHDTGSGASLQDLYDAFETKHPHLVDNEPDPHQPSGLRWKHDLRWEVETLVGSGAIRRRKDLGRGLYSA